ncbi:zinc-dependent peptidase [Reichenbachiella ulvae]|uniref:Zinc-dependent peptidase n=1 Tax=Reichenbachiella ulvae TaxID=2980104 RepID=A0ABT3CU55_9BACT|nr:zinc-dependent peptidase [Reichenbachiella ulvae]MCV9387054.1 zinc-dependent peptidase [Reichenbachiella ulvae]
MSFISLFILLALLAMMVYIVGGEVVGAVRGTRYVLNYLFRQPINRYLIIRNLNPEYKKILEGAFLYYHTLNVKNKRLFEKRVQKFIDSKNFYPAGELLQVEPEMKVLIAASAIQLTFGLPGVYFAHFKDIYVYPDFYFSEGMQQFNAGEVHKAGRILLSWKDFVEGYVHHDNGRNLGLHEMAHALRLENMIKNEEYSYFDWEDIQIFNHYTVEESNKINQGLESIFRPYAAVHYQEFFAVLIEVFFEQPKKLKEYHPNLYLVTSRLLRQDPMRPNERVA